MSLNRTSKSTIHSPLVDSGSQSKNRQPPFWKDFGIFTSVGLRMTIQEFSPPPSKKICDTKGIPKAPQFRSTSFVHCLTKFCPPPPPPPPPHATHADTSICYWSNMQTTVKGYFQCKHSLQYVHSLQR